MRRSRAVSRHAVWVRPLAVVGAILLMASVILPTASMAAFQTQAYNDGDGDDNFQRGLNVVIGAGVVGGVAHLIGKRKKRGNQSHTPDHGAGPGPGAGTGGGQGQ